MARPLDPFRALEVPRDASLDEVKASYRRLAKLYHPDSAGDRALPRFLAIQAAYEALTEGPAALRLGTNPRPRPGSGRPARPSEADTERARATREAAGRGGRMRQPPGGAPGSTGRGSAGGASPRAAGPDGSGATAGRSGAAGGTGPRTSSGPDRGAPRGSAGATTGRGGSTGSASSSGSGSARTGPGRTGTGSTGSTGSTRRDRRKPSSTSYDGADLEPFEPQWQGASWYGESSGTYWTINPKEFADPRKHGPEYQARGRRAARAERSGPRATAAGASTRRPAASSRAAHGDDPADPMGPTQTDTPPPAATGATQPTNPADWATRPPPTDDPGTFRAPRPESLDWTAPFAAPVAEAPDSARPPFAVFGVFAILMGAIGTILVLSPAGPASAGFVPIVFLAAILAAAGLVLGGLRGGRRA